MKYALLGCLCAVAILLGGCSAPDNYAYRGTPYNPPVPATDILGTRAGNTPFQLSKINEKVKMVFFGYTSCPDVCPTTLSTMSGVYKKLSPEVQKQVAMIFVSVDPDRDTPEKMATFVQAFDPGIYGVHVTPEHLAELKKGYHVYAEKHLEVGKPLDPLYYFIDHTSAVFLIDKDNKLREIFTNDAPLDNYVIDIQHLLSQ
jgi:protein SCO1/2